jgi:hypothetical protein
MKQPKFHKHHKTRHCTNFKLPEQKDDNVQDIHQDLFLHTEVPKHKPKTERSPYREEIPTQRNSPPGNVTQACKTIKENTNRQSMHILFKNIIMAQDRTETEN